MKEVKKKILNNSLYTRIRRNAIRDKIFPDILMPSFSPSLELKVTYEDGLAVRKGHMVAPQRLVTPPRVEFVGLEAAKYTFVMSSPDELSAKGKESLHWLVTNIAGSNFASGEHLCKYLPPIPVRGVTEEARYAFVLMEHPTAEPLQFSHLLRDGRSGWSTYALKEEFDLKPVGLCYFKSRWDASVSQTWQSFFPSLKEPVLEDATEMDDSHLYKRSKYIWLQ